MVNTLSDTLNERQNAADSRRAETDEHLPFTSILVRKLQAEIEDNKSLAQEASNMALLFSNLIKQSIQSRVISCSINKLSNFLEIN